MVVALRPENLVPRTARPEVQSPCSRAVLPIQSGHAGVRRAFPGHKLVAAGLWYGSWGVPKEFPTSRMMSAPKTCLRKRAITPDEVLLLRRQTPEAPCVDEIAPDPMKFDSSERARFLAFSPFHLLGEM